jgi:exocyst complex component 4
MKAANKMLKPYEDGLTRALKDTVPGLAPGAGGDPSQTIISGVTNE